MSPVSLSVPTLIIELVIFLSMVSAMEAWVFNPIRRAWADRDRAIQEGLAASSESREETEQARAAVRRILAEARGQAQSRLDQATAAAGKLRDQLVAEATDEFRRLLDKARQDIAAERERTAETLRDRIVDIALLAATRVTGQRFDQPQVRELAAAVVRREGLR
jgi:F-type H+-transporting ATPase subunit b